MKFLAIVVLIFAASFGLISCRTAKIQDYEGLGPEFDLFSFFSGELEARGFFQDRSGKVVKRIECQMKGRIEGDELVVDEHFSYSDRSHSDRTWRFKKDSRGQFTGTAADVKEVMAIETKGFAFNMNYVLNLPYENKTLEVNMNDWMYRVSPSLVLNKTKMTKFGFYIGEVTLAIHKLK